MDQQIVLVTNGLSSIESFGDGRWRKADDRSRTLGFNAPMRSHGFAGTGCVDMGSSSFIFPR